VQAEVDPLCQDGLVFLDGPDEQRAKADFSELSDFVLDRVIRGRLGPESGSNT